MLKDDRQQGVSYGYVIVPQGGKVVDGVKFPEGPRPAGKKGWFKLLLQAGCDEISQAEYEDLLSESQDLSRKGAANVAAVHGGGDQGKAPAVRRKRRPGRDAGRVPAGG